MKKHLIMPNGGVPTIKKATLRSLLAACLLFVTTTGIFAQAGIHDPSRTMQNTDGRYWHFATGQGIYAISSTVPTFTNWRTETTPFGSGYPSWVASYVTGFTGFFWAPDVIKLGSKYLLYYSCAGTGAPAAIGVMAATNLSGPWSDYGMVVHGNNCIDPAPVIDGSNVYLAWGNWQSGIDLCQISTSTAKPTGSTSHLLSGSVEGPYIIKNGSYYYLFFQRGLCCNGVNSTYYVCVQRSTSIRGPYSGERTFMVNKYGRIIGPGHVGYGAGVMSFHFYDGNDNGAPKLGQVTLSWGTDGYPIPGIFNDANEIDIIDPANTNAAVEVYPNPSSNGNFTVSGLKLRSTITVMDMQGREIFRTISDDGSDKANIQLKLSPNTYIVRVENNKAASNKKLVVE